MGVAKVGADVLLLNTSFAARQLTEVCQREDAVALIYDEEFTELVREAGADRLRFVAWHEGRETEDPKLSDLVGEGDVGAVSPPARTGRVTILTSGTTGTPKGASRHHAGDARPAGGAAGSDSPARGSGGADRGAPLPRLGILQLRPGDGTRLHLRAAPAL